MKNGFHVDYFKSYLPAKSGIFFFFIFLRVGIYALDFRYTIASEINNDWSTVV